MKFTERNLISIYKNYGFHATDGKWLHADVQKETPWVLHRGQYDKEVIFSIDDELYSFIIKKRYSKKLGKMTLFVPNIAESVYQVSTF